MHQILSSSDSSRLQRRAVKQMQREYNLSRSVGAACDWFFKDRNMQPGAFGLGTFQEQRAMSLGRGV